MASTWKTAGRLGSDKTTKNSVWVDHSDVYFENERLSEKLRSEVDGLARERRRTLLSRRRAMAVVGGILSKLTVFRFSRVLAGGPVNAQPNCGRQDSGGGGLSTNGRQRRLVSAPALRESPGPASGLARWAGVDHVLSAGDRFQAEPLGGRPRPSHARSVRELRELHTEPAEGWMAPTRERSYIDALLIANRRQQQLVDRRVEEFIAELERER